MDHTSPRTPPNSRRACSTTVWAVGSIVPHSPQLALSWGTAASRCCRTPHQSRRVPQHPKALRPCSAPPASVVHECGASGLYTCPIGLVAPCTTTTQFVLSSAAPPPHAACMPCLLQHAHCWLPVRQVRSLQADSFLPLTQNSSRFALPASLPQTAHPCIRLPSLCTTNTLLDYKDAALQASKSAAAHDTPVLQQLYLAHMHKPPPLPCGNKAGASHNNPSAAQSKLDANTG
jgi:hypothetical protein